MTYKELLFKMASRGMLTLSNDKDGRGLFWAATGKKVEANRNESFTSGATNKAGSKKSIKITNTVNTYLNKCN